MQKTAKSLNQLHQINRESLYDKLQQQEPEKGQTYRWTSQHSELHNKQALQSSKVIKLLPKAGAILFPRNTDSNNCFTSRNNKEKVITRNFNLAKFSQTYRARFLKAYYRKTKHKQLRELRK